MQLGDMIEALENKVNAMKTEMKEVKKVSKKLSSLAGADMEKTH